MEKLRDYLNSLEVEQQHAYATQCRTTLAYLRKAISVKARMDGELCRLLDEHSGGKVPKEELRPGIWPELVSAA